MQVQARISIVLWGTVLVAPLAAEERLRLAGRNTETPFASRAAGERSWPITLGPPDTKAALELQLRQEEQIVERGTQIRVGNVSATLTPTLQLRVVVGARSTAKFSLPVRRVSGHRVETHGLRFQPAPVDPRISYIPDLVDDLILYESTDWLYYLPIDDPHAYVRQPQDP